MIARIYKPTKTAMQSGLARTKRWALDYEANAPRIRDPLMGWTGTIEPTQQVRLWFATQEDAVAYAERQGLEYRLESEIRPKRRLASYSDNFSTQRDVPWTH
jgi:ETC complex I subunit conserved region